MYQCNQWDQVLTAGVDLWRRRERPTVSSVVDTLP